MQSLHVLVRVLSLVRNAHEHLQYSDNLIDLKVLNDKNALLANVIK